MPAGRVRATSCTKASACGQAAFVPTGGRYSELAAEVGAKLGVAVLRVNQSSIRNYVLAA